MSPEVFTAGYTTGTAQQVLNAAREQRFTGTLAFHTGAGWLLALVVSGEAEQLARLGSYPGVLEAGQYVMEYAHEARLSAELPAQAGWPLLPVTATWAPAHVPWPIVQRALSNFTGIIFLHNEAHSAGLIEQGKLTLVRSATGGAPAASFQAAYEQATNARLVPLPSEFLPALHTATPPAELYRGSSVVLTLSNPAPPVADAAAPSEEPAAKAPPVEPAAEAAAATSVETPATTTPTLYRLTLRGADALDPMTDRAAEFRAEFTSESLSVLRAIRAQTPPQASAELLRLLVRAGYIYAPEDPQ